MKILILTSSTGGGHDMRARSLQAWAEKEKDLDVRVTIHQALENLHGIYKFGVELYNFIQRSWPMLHHVYFNYLELVGLFRTAPFILGKEKFRAVLERVRPDVIVSVHGQTNHGFFQLARNYLGEENVSCVTYCGELYGGYGFSRHWVNPRSDLFIGAVEETCQTAIRHGMTEDKAWRGGFLLHPSFWDPEWSKEERDDFVDKRLGFDPGEFLLVLGTGAQGANNHIPFLNALWKSYLRPQVLVLCGKSPHTLQSITEWALDHPGLRVKGIPFSHDMASILRAADAIVARPGTGLRSEAIMADCPVILNGVGGIMPQEWITTKFCRTHGISEVVRRPADLPPIVKDWMENPDKLADIRERMRTLRPKVSPRDILLKLISLPPNPPNITPPRTGKAKAKENCLNTESEGEKGLCPPPNPPNDSPPAEESPESIKINRTLKENEAGEPKQDSPASESQTESGDPSPTKEEPSKGDKQNPGTKKKSSSDSSGLLNLE